MPRDEFSRVAIAFCEWESKNRNIFFLLYRLLPCRIANIKQRNLAKKEERSKNENLRSSYYMVCLPNVKDTVAEISEYMWK